MNLLQIGKYLVDPKDRLVNMEWLVPGAVALFRSHLQPFVGPAPFDGMCVVHAYSPESCEIKGMVSKNMGREKMVRGYRTVCKMMAAQGFTGVKMEVFNEDGTSTVWIDGKRQGVIPCTAC